MDIHGMDGGEEVPDGLAHEEDPDDMTHPLDDDALTGKVLNSSIQAMKMRNWRWSEQRWRWSTRSAGY